MVNNFSKPRTRAFSSAELILAIVILLVVAAILFPVFARARERARQVSCLSNEKELALGIIQYCQDYDGRFPCGTHPAPLQSIPAGWAGQIYPYMLSSNEYKCPDDPTVPDAGEPYLLPISYAYNSNVGYVAERQRKIGKAALLINSAKNSDLTLPARTVLFCEIEDATCDIQNLHGAEVSSPSVVGGVPVLLSNIDGDVTSMRYATGILRSDPASAVVVGKSYGNATALTGRHNDGSNFVLADGHAKWLKPSSVSAGLTNNISSKDCTAGQGLLPAGKAGPGYAAGTGCSDTAIAATFSIK